MAVMPFVADSSPDPLKCGWLNRSELETQIERIEKCDKALTDEQVLTYLCAYGYAIAPQGAQALARVLLKDEALTYDGEIWFEFLPVSPRNREGETHFDLALGDVRIRHGTRSGLEVAPLGPQPSWIAAVEAKLRSDLSAHVRYDAFRNQLVRVIENAVTLRDLTGAMPNTVHVVLLTPKVFKDHPRTRFYGCKFEEYCPNGRVDASAILADLGRLELQTVTYDCAVADRLACLSLHWVTFEDVISKMPEGNAYKSCLVQLVSRAGSLVRL